MNVHHFEPDARLQQDVKSFWTFEQSQADHNSAPVLPDSHVELIFNCGAPYVLQTENGALVDLPRVIVNGLQEKPIHLRVTGACQFIAVRLYGWAVRPLIDLPDNPYALPVIPLNGQWQRIAQTVEATVRHNGYQAAVDLLQQFILDIQHPQPGLEAIRTAGAMLHTSCGKVRLSEVAAQSHLSQRQFERQFKYWMGVPPKTYARLIRHEATRDLLFRDPGCDMVMVAQDFGYSDQAHFIHDFKAFTARTPREYTAHIRSMTSR